MFERFTDAARDVYKTALDRTRLYGMPEVGDAQLLLSLSVVESEASAALVRHGVTEHQIIESLNIRPKVLNPDALAATGIDLDAVRRAAEQTFGPGALDNPSPTSGFIPTSDTLKATLTQAGEFANLLCDPSIWPGHFLLALLSVPDSDGIKLIADIASDPMCVVKLRREMFHLLSADAA